MNDYNYHNDSRVQAGQRTDWYKSINPSNMCAVIVLTDEESGDEVEHTVSFKFAVCPTCRGKGSHVNPSIDAGGITSSEWEEWDEEDRESYMSGAYDVQCYECKGNRVIPEMDRDSVSPELLEQIDRIDRENAEFEAVCRAERMMGA